jgi:hypothetical protein
MKDLDDAASVQSENYQPVQVDYYSGLAPQQNSEQYINIQCDKIFKQ